MQACVTRFLTPVRDEEAESQRKARSRQARQTRRSTQGVTLADLKEAEKMFGQSQPEKNTTETERWEGGKTAGRTEEGDRPEAKSLLGLPRNPEENRPWRTRSHSQEDLCYPRQRFGSQAENPSPTSANCFLFPNSSLTSRLPTRISSKDSNRNGQTSERKNDGEIGKEHSDFLQSLRERRQAREQNLTSRNREHDRTSRLDSASSAGDDSSTDRLLSRISSYTRRENRLASLGKGDEDSSSSKDYKKLYEDALSENEKLKNKLQENKQELSKIRGQLDRASQKQDRTSEKSTVLESEKKEKRALEKKVSDMEEELKENQQRPRSFHH
ncbi:protein phosphatase 1 regulatory subunit 12B isoform X2 [Polypterus senegalus]|uniref:protein phosphatase 1 regulatory subunit 12B isoform X2 n=1 Tax=Polypterus senegalus TaxID=55291 RepID=UPI00196553B1|nr:protein phosphatase 1 regulatory subunit 12B isoform X2 [Polypterus senegalus]